MWQWRIMGNLTIGEKIKDLRKKNKCSQEELAVSMNLTRQTISKWESNSAQPSFENIRLLCSVFNVDISYFTDETAESKEILKGDLDNNVAATEITDKKPKKNFLWLIFAILSFAGSVVSCIVTIVTALIVFSSNNGDSKVNTSNVTKSSFVFSLLLFILLLTLAIILFVIYRKRIKTNKNRQKNK